MDGWIHTFPYSSNKVRTFQKEDSISALLCKCGHKNIQVVQLHEEKKTHKRVPPTQTPLKWIFDWFVPIFSVLKYSYRRYSFSKNCMIHSAEVARYWVVRLQINDTHEINTPESWHPLAFTSESISGVKSWAMFSKFQDVIYVVVSVTSSGQNEKFCSVSPRARQDPLKGWFLAHVSEAWHICITTQVTQAGATVSQNSH